MHDLEPIIDAHQHFWNPSHGDYSWMKEQHAPIRRPMWEEDLRVHLRPAGVLNTVLVQTWSSLEETRSFMLLADRVDFVSGVVGWIDLTDPDVADVLSLLKSLPHGKWLKGIRHQVHDEPDADWLLRPDVMRGLQAVDKSGLTFDLLIRPREIDAAVQVVERFPNMRFVVDHIAKPGIADRQMEPWRTKMTRFGPFRNVWCKLSGMVTEAAWDDNSTDQFRPYVDHILGVFGVDRVMIGSDWPVCTLAASYERTISIMREVLASLSAEDRKQIFTRNALEAYRLDVGI